MNWTAVQGIVGAFAFLALLWYAWETRVLRLETQRQARLASLPIARVELHRAPARIFLRNTGQAPVGRAALQGFQFRGGDGGNWRCTFTPITMLSPGGDIPIFDDITQEGYESKALLDERALFDAFSRALSGRESIRLRLWTADVFGTSHYVTEVEIPAAEFTRWKEHGRPASNWQPPVQPLSTLRAMPSPLPLADFT